MEIKLIDNIPQDIIMNNRFIRWINFANKTVVRLIDSLRDCPKEKILNVLNSINKQNIQDISIERRVYTHRGKEISFEEMANSEKLFLLAFAADYSKTKIYFCNEIESLTETVLKIFIDTFRYSQYVNIAYIDDSSSDYLDYVYRSEVA